MTASGSSKAWQPSTPEQKAAKAERDRRNRMRRIREGTLPRLTAEQAARKRLYEQERQKWRSVMAAFIRLLIVRGVITEQEAREQWKV